MRRIRLTATLTAALLLLAGCGAQQGASEGNQQHKEPEQAQQQPEPETSERGNLVKHIGDTAYIYADTSEKTEWARWTVTNITLDAPCTNEYAEPSENGHMVVMDVTAQTTKDLPTDQPLYLGAPGAWQYVLKDGTISNAPVQGSASTMCLPQADMLPDTIGTASKAQGKLVFDLPTTDGYLVYKDVDATGWEYPLS